MNVAPFFSDCFIKWTANLLYHAERRMGGNGKNASEGASMCSDQGVIRDQRPLIVFRSGSIIEETSRTTAAGSSEHREKSTAFQVNLRNRFDRFQWAFLSARARHRTGFVRISGKASSQNCVPAQTRTGRKTAGVNGVTQSCLRRMVTLAAWAVRPSFSASRQMPGASCARPP